MKMPAYTASLQTLQVYLEGSLLMLHAYWVEEFNVHWTFESFMLVNRDREFVAKDIQDLKVLLLEEMRLRYDFRLNAIDTNIMKSNTFYEFLTELQKMVS